VHAEVSHFGTSTIRIRFGPLAGSAEFDPQAQTGRVDLRIATAAASTGLPVFDGRLREADLLDSAGQPEAFFVAQRFVFAGRELREVRGEFTLRGTSLPLALTVQRFACYTSPLLQREVCGGDFVAEIERGAYGITFGRPWVGDKVRLQIQVEAIRQ